MEFISLGKTNCVASRTAFTVPLLSEHFNLNDAISEIRLEYENGCNYFDAGKTGDESDRILCYAFNEIRQEVHYIVHISQNNPVLFRNEVETRLSQLDTDYIDTVVIDDLDFVPYKGSEDGLFDVIKELQGEKKIISVAFASDDIDLLKLAISSQCYECIVTQFNILSGEELENIVKYADNLDVTVIAKNPLNDGKIKDLPLAVGFLSSFENIVGLWSLEDKDAITQVLYFSSTPPVIDSKFKEDVENLKVVFQ